MPQPSTKQNTIAFSFGRAANWPSVMVGREMSCFIIKQMRSTLFGRMPTKTLHFIALSIKAFSTGLYKSYRCSQKRTLWTIGTMW